MYTIFILCTLSMILNLGLFNIFTFFWMLKNSDGCWQILFVLGGVGLPLGYFDLYVAVHFLEGYFNGGFMSGLVNIGNLLFYYGREISGEIIIDTANELAYSIPGLLIDGSGLVPFNSTGLIIVTIMSILINIVYIWILRES